MDWTKKGREWADQLERVGRPWVLLWHRGTDDERRDYLRQHFADLLSAARWGASPSPMLPEHHDAQRLREAEALRLLVEGFTARLREIAGC